MTRVTLDAATRAKLTQRTELFDENGRLVGLFLTPEEYFQLVCAEAQHDFDHTTRDECLRDIQENGGVPAEEVRKMFAENRRRWEERQ